MVREVFPTVTTFSIVERYAGWSGSSAVFLIWIATCQVQYSNCYLDGSFVVGAVGRTRPLLVPLFPVVGVVWSHKSSAICAAVAFTISKKNSLRRPQGTPYKTTSFLPSSSRRCAWWEAASWCAAYWGIY